MGQGIDAHCHLEYMDVEVVVQEAKQKMTAIVTSIADIKDREKIIALHRRHPDFVFACIGFHPEIMDKYNDGDIEDYFDFIRLNKKDISAVGEVGLDYNWITRPGDQERSREIFTRFVKLAKKLEKPLVIHSRNGKGNLEGSDDGIQDSIDILIKNNCSQVMMHCFSGSETQLKVCLEKGWLISFATLVCKSFKHQRLARIVPTEKMLLETDAPWLDPDSSELVNRPWKIERSAETIASIKGISKEEVLKITEENAKKFFNIS